jgi:hypothetical protein
LATKDQAFVWLEKAQSEKSNNLGYIKVDHLLDGLHTDYRYLAMLKKMGLPQ